ncbi:MAG: beta-lactamase family protein [Planctomycetes bacterium]|nr:beta-lactamase family protein [Planctomycetota bacterium]
MAERRIVVVFAWTAVLAAAAAARGQDLATEIWAVRHDNETGDHAAAAERAEQLIDAASGTVGQRCDLWLHLAFARTKLGRDDADAAFDAFAEAAAGLDRDDPLRVEMALLRESLALPPLAGLAVDTASFTPPATDGYWRIGDADDAALDEATRTALAELARRSGSDGLLVTRGGAILFESYSPLYREPMFTMSSCKSITGLLAAMLAARGTIDLDDAVGNYLPGWREGRRGAVTIRHLLTMTAGLPRRSNVAHEAGESWNEYAERQEPVRAPGERWEYSNEGAQLLSPILEFAVRRPLADFARTELFEPIGATATAMRQLRGATNTYADAMTTLREFARFGELVRRGGEWPGSGQVVPRAALDAMLAPCEQNRGYASLWWVEPDGRGWSMRGYLSTSVWVWPKLDIVAARVQHRAYLHVREPFDPDRLYELLSAAPNGK